MDQWILCWFYWTHNHIPNLEPIKSRKTANRILNASWKTPDKDKFKMNVDASIDMDRYVFSLGLVVQNFRGKVMMTASLNRQGWLSVAEEKTAAISKDFIWRRNKDSAKQSRGGSLRCWFADFRYSGYGFPFQNNLHLFLLLKVVIGIPIL